MNIFYAHIRIRIVDRKDEKLNEIFLSPYLHLKIYNVYNRPSLKLTFSEKATKVDKIFIVNLTVCKGQLISKAKCQAVDSPKK